MEQDASDSPRLIGKPGAWKCEAVDLQLKLFEKQNRRRTRRMENMKRHEKNLAEEKKISERMRKDEELRRENARQRLEQKRAIEKKRKKATYAKRMQTKIALEQEANKRKQALAEKRRKERQDREDQVRKAKERARQLKASRSRDKLEKRQQRLQNVRIAEEKKQADMRKQWAEKEERTGQLREQKREKRKVAKIARDLLNKTKHDRAFQARKGTLQNRRWKTAAKIEKLYKKAELLEAIEYATNEELKEISRLKWINKQRIKKPKEETPGPGHYFGGHSPISKRRSKSAEVESEYKQVKGSFPSLSQARSELRELISPIVAKTSGAWTIHSKVMSSDDHEHKTSTPRGSLPNVSVHQLYSFK